MATTEDLRDPLPGILEQFPGKNNHKFSPIHHKMSNQIAVSQFLKQQHYQE